MVAELADPFCLALPAAQAAPGAVDLRRCAAHTFVGFTRHRGPAYFDQAIHLCSQAGFSPRIRYEASTVHGVLDLVAAGLGVALVPASVALIGVPGVAVRRLERRGAGETLALVVRRGEDRSALARAVAAIFAAITPKIDKLLAG